MAEKRVLGDVLIETGRMTAADVERTLAHQRAHGGYFGEAAVELGILRREEIDWALANQLDLPFIFPDAQAADRRAAGLVSPAWALAHLAVPIVRSRGSVTVVVADPLDSGTLDDLRARTGLKVEMALASASRIRELIHALYDDSGAVERPGTPAGEWPSGEAAASLRDLVTQALAEGADRVGISTRGAIARGWYSVGERRERRRLESGWEAALEGMLDPSPLAAARETPGLVRPFQATLRHRGREFLVDVQAATSPSGAEVLLRPRRRAAPSSSGRTLPEAMRTDLRLLAREGDARVGVVGPATDILPRLPGLVLGDTVRAAHVTPQADVPGAFVLPVHEDVDLVALLDAYAFDALSTDVPLDDGRLPGILAGAPLAFAAVPSDDDPAALDRAGINWILAAAPDQDTLVWELRPVKH